MEEEAKKIASKLLSTGEVDAILGLKKEHKHAGPFLFLNKSELTSLTLSPKYSLVAICKRIQEVYPNKKIGVFMRGCDERALIELAKRNQIDLSKIKIIGVACSIEEAKKCGCSKPFPRKIEIGSKVKEKVVHKNAEALLKKSLKERFEFWQNAFSKCIKCYGCKNACPVCFCEECALEHKIYVLPGEIPPEVSFHLIRAYHMADRCIFCHECEEACPMSIPLTALYTLLHRDVKKLFDYEPGMSLEHTPPLATTLEEVPIKEKYIP